MSAVSAVRINERWHYAQQFNPSIIDDYGKQIPQAPGAPVKIRGGFLPASGLFWERTQVGQLETGDEFFYVRKRWKIGSKDFIWKDSLLIDGQLRGGIQYQVKSKMNFAHIGRGWGAFDIFIVSQRSGSITPPQAENLIWDATDPFTPLTVANDPPAPTNGLIWYNETEEVFKFRENNVTRVLNEDKNYVHVQGAPVTSITIQHNLQKHPSVTVIDTAGNELWVEVDYLDTNRVQLQFSKPRQFTAIFN